MKNYYLIPVPNYPASKIDDAKVRCVETTKLKADAPATQMARDLNGGETYHEAFAKAKGSKEYYQSFQARSFYHVEVMTFAQARDYRNFESWPQEPETLPVE